jgi:hypothetical protein
MQRRKDTVVTSDTDDYRIHRRFGRQGLRLDARVSKTRNARMGFLPPKVFRMS